MFPSTHAPIMSVPFARTIAIAALMGTTFLATPLATSRALAQAVTPTPVAATATEAKG
jgi:hypothetical protein